MEPIKWIFRFKYMPLLDILQMLFAHVSTVTDICKLLCA